MSFANYGLDPAWFQNAPGLAYCAALKITKVSLELISASNMYLMIENGIRGGISMISKIYSNANNKYLVGYDKSKGRIFIVDLKLPVASFKWICDDELNNWENIPCFLEVDLECPESLHNYQNCYPLAPERKTVGKVQKLLPNLDNKTNYVIHHKVLKNYIQKGLVVKNIHRGIKFREEAWLKHYIKLKTQLRTAGKTNFEKDFFKLMNNNVCGKMMENVRNRVDDEKVEHLG
ncbi:Hypothetical predicted protein [Paramuricea clavata]|uniref:Uncharacterized protein n=1 Tax=Paramuricea clavata TaxID=317549 RepID=A0A7D9HVT7_PARCT|nr:Hypothetical predicted protein [Paramuricea clavata]